MKFDKLVEAYMQVIEEEIEMPYGRIDDHVKIGVKMLRAAIEPTAFENGKPIGGKIVNQKQYEKALDYFRKIGKSGEIISGGGSTEPLRGAIYANISDDEFGSKLFNTVYNAWDDGWMARTRKEIEKGDKKKEKSTAKKMKKDGSDINDPNNWVQDDSDEDLIFSYDGSRPKGQKFTRGGAWNG